MACNSEGMCFDNFIDLCDSVGQSCYLIENTFSGLIQNQFGMASAIAPVLPGVSALPTCSRVYLDPDTCTFANAGAYPIGVHLFDGRVQLDGKHACVTAICADGEELPTCGSFLDNDFQKTTNIGNASWLLLEDATTDGCALAMKLWQPRICYFDQFTDGGMIIPANTTFVDPTVITVPYAGVYHVSEGVAVVADVDGCVEAGVIINGNDAVLTPQIGDNVSPGCEQTYRSDFYIELSAGDTIEFFVQTQTANLIVNIEGLQVRYEGAPCPA